MRRKNKFGNSNSSVFIIVVIFIIAIAVIIWLPQPVPTPPGPTPPGPPTPPSPTPPSPTPSGPTNYCIHQVPDSTFLENGINPYYTCDPITNNTNDRFQLTWCGSRKTTPWGDTDVPVYAVYNVSNGGVKFVANLTYASITEITSINGKMSDNKTPMVINKGGSNTYADVRPNELINEARGNDDSNHNYPYVAFASGRYDDGTSGDSIGTAYIFEIFATINGDEGICKKHVQVSTDGSGKIKLN